MCRKWEQKGADEQKVDEESRGGCNGATGELFHTSLWFCPANDPVISVCICLCVRHCFRQVSDIESCYLTHCCLPETQLIQPPTHTHTQKHAARSTALDQRWFHPWVGEMKNDFASWGWVYIWLSLVYSTVWWSTRVWSVFKWTKSHLQ